MESSVSPFFFISPFVSVRGFLYWCSSGSWEVIMNISLKTQASKSIFFFLLSGDQMVYLSAPVSRPNELPQLQRDEIILKDCKTKATLKYFWKTKTKQNKKTQLQIQSSCVSAGAVWSSLHHLQRYSFQGSAWQGLICLTFCTLDQIYIFQTWSGKTINWTPEQ